MYTERYWVQVNERIGGSFGQICQNWVQIGQILDFFRSDFSTFWLGSQNVIKSDLKNPGFVPFGAYLTNISPKFAMSGIGWDVYRYDRCVRCITDIIHCTVHQVVKLTHIVLLQTSRRIPVTKQI